MDERPPAAPRPPGTFKVGTVAGSDVLVSSSWFVVAGLIALIMAPLVEQVEPGLGALRYVAGLAFAVLLYGSVLLHEASHAVAAKRLGMRTVWVSGGARQSPSVDVKVASVLDLPRRLSRL